MWPWDSHEVARAFVLLRRWSLYYLDFIRAIRHGYGCGVIKSVCVSFLLIAHIGIEIDIIVTLPVRNAFRSLRKFPYLCAIEVNVQVEHDATAFRRRLRLVVVTVGLFVTCPGRFG